MNLFPITAEILLLAWNLNKCVEMWYRWNFITAACLKALVILCREIEKFISEVSAYLKGKMKREKRR